MYRRRNREFEQICKLASERVSAVLRCLAVLVPDATPRQRKKITNRILTMCDGKDRRVRITQEQARDLIMPHTFNEED